MIEEFLIYIDRLKEGEVKEIEETVSSDFLEVSEPDLQFRFPIHFVGSVVKSQRTLVIKLSIDTQVVMPCAICNEKVPTPLQVPAFYHAEELENITSKIFNFKEVLRDALLIELPPRIECHEGNCPERQNMAQYLKKHNPPAEETSPFANL